MSFPRPPQPAGAARRLCEAPWAKSKSKYVTSTMLNLNLFKKQPTKACEGIRYLCCASVAVLPCLLCIEIPIWIHAKTKGSKLFDSKPPTPSPRPQVPSRLEPRFRILCSGLPQPSGEALVAAKDSCSSRQCGQRLQRFVDSRSISGGSNSFTGLGGSTMHILGCRVET